VGLSAAGFGEGRPANTASLAHQLARDLDREQVLYCQWTGHRQPARLRTGDGDIDLLVDQASLPRFARVLVRLGFTRPVARPARRLPAVDSYFGHDPLTGRLVRVHAHHAVVVRGPWRTTYRLPIDAPCLASAERRAVFRAPAPEYELIAFVVRMVQRYAVRDALLRRDPPWLPHIWDELASLRARANRASLTAILARSLPSVTPTFLDRCLQSLEPGWSPLRRVALRHQLRRRLARYARREGVSAAFSALLGREAAQRRRPGGMVIAVNGHDAVETATCVQELEAWLFPNFVVRRAHFGRAPRSLATRSVGAALGVAGRLGLRAQLQPLRDLCRARDRYRLGIAVRRFAAAGGVALCEQYPLPEARALPWPSVVRGPGTSAGPLRTLLRRRERRYDARIARPDLSIVLRLEPALAAPPRWTEPGDDVSARAQTGSEKDWTQAGARVVHAGRPLPEVIADLKALIWSAL
jgi:hypothetical protein